MVRGGFAIASICAGEGGASAVSGLDPVPSQDLYLQHGRTVHRYCLARLLAHAYGAYVRAQPSEVEARAWLLRIARNVVNDHFRSKLRHRLLVGRIWRNSAPPIDPQHQAVVNRQREEVLRALGTLSRREREQIGVRAAAALSYSEISQQLGPSENAVTVATYRAISKLRRYVAMPA